MLSALHACGAGFLYPKFSSHLGCILTFHHVRDIEEQSFSPNSHLSVTPEFFERTIQLCREKGVDFVSLDEVPRRIEQADSSKQFVAFTFDDGYRNNLEIAAPILRKYGVPYTVFVATGLVDGHADLWWEGIEVLIRKRDVISVPFADGLKELDCSTVSAKRSSYRFLINYLWRELSEKDVQQFVRRLCERYEVDLNRIRSDLMMSWDEVRELAQDPLCTIGAHTITHPVLARLNESEARDEIRQGAAALEAELGYQPRHIAFPFGTVDAAGAREFELAKKSDYLSGVTTRPGMIFPEHGQHLTALPRISINGLYQDKRYIAPLLGGLPTMLLNRGSKLQVA